VYGDGKPPAECTGGGGGGTQLSQNFVLRLWMLVNPSVDSWVGLHNTYTHTQTYLCDITSMFHSAASCAQLFRTPCSHKGAEFHVEINWLISSRHHTVSYRNISASLLPKLPIYIKITSHSFPNPPTSDVRTTRNTC
jgi:hypothetical protein